MSHPIFDFPEAENKLVPWLERKLVGPELREIAAALEVMHGVSTTNETPLPEIESRWDDLLKRGLSVLPRATISQLLKEPQRLLALQERIFEEGGDYWFGLLEAEAPGEIARSAEHQRKRIIATMQPAAVAPAPPGAKSIGRRALSLALAASILGIAVVSWRYATAPTVRGWNRTDAFASTNTAQEYYAQLAARLSEHSSPPIETSSELAARMGEVRTACDALLAASHEPLSQAQRDDLRKRCRDWAAKIDTLRTQLAQEGRFTKVRGEFLDLLNRAGDRLKKLSEETA